MTEGPTARLLETVGEPGRCTRKTVRTYRSAAGAGNSSGAIAARAAARARVIDQFGPFIDSMGTGVWP